MLSRIVANPSLNRCNSGEVSGSVIGLVEGHMTLEVTFLEKTTILHNDTMKNQNIKPQH